MGEIRAKLIERIKRLPSVESFRFMPYKKVSFQPGQFVRVNFDEKNPNNKELNKYLSLSCSPTKDYIEVTKKISDSEFSKRLSSLKIGDELLFGGPMGNCVFKDEYKKICFLIGGIGITPVISIIEYIAENKIDTNVVLFYSNRTEDDIAFRRELEQWYTINNNIEVFYAVTECQPKDNICIGGRINRDLLSNKLTDIYQRIFFIFGPPKMVEAMKALALELNCNKNNIKTESFIGY